MSWDVAVVGGGVSGAVAAIASARNGARTLLVERYGFCGGSLTNAGVGPMMTFHAGGRQVVAGIGEEIVRRLQARGASPGHIEDTTGYASSITPFDAEALKRVLDELLEEAGCTVLYHAALARCQVEGDRLRSAEFAAKGGLMTLAAAVWVDATGDGELFAAAGVPFDLGREADGLCQPMTTNVRLGGVDIAAVRAELRAHPERFRVKDPTSLDRAPRLAVAGYEPETRQAIREGQLHFERECVLFFETPNPGEVILNMTRVVKLDPTDPWALSRAERLGRQQAWEAYLFLREHIPAFGNAVLLSTGPQIGVRESRRLRGRYRLTAEDLLSSRRFADAVAAGGYPVDIHNPAGNDTHTTHLAPGQAYQIPYRCLVPETLGNLLVAGRCISATHEACAAIRVSPIAMATGQAAGTAASLCHQRNTTAGALPVQALQAALRRDGAVFEPEQP